MFGRSATQRDRNNNESSQPLLTDDHDNVRSSPIIFALNDSDDEPLPSPPLTLSRSLSPSPSAPPPQQQQQHSVRFHDYVQVIGPPLRSTTHSREVGA